MQKYVLFPVLLILLCSCNDRSKEYSVDEIRFNDNAVVVCDELKVKGEKKIPLGSLVDSLQIIRIENGKNAFFKFGWIAISPNYFAIRQSQGGAVKLFDKKGKFLGNIGNVGRGPGEYQNVSDILIDETDGAVYLSQISGDKVLQYNLQGEFVNAITFPERINKPKLFLNPDGTISLVHLCFTDRGNTFTSATFNPAVPDSIKLLFSKDLALSARDNEGKSIGYNYRNLVIPQFK